MGDVVKLKAGLRKDKRKARAKGRTLCGRGFHKWEIWQKKQFDVKSGRLVTVHKCARCGAQKTTLT